MELRLSIWLVLILFSTNSLTAQINSANNYKLTLDKFQKENIRGTKYWLVECTLTNDSKDTLSYLSMSCSWPDFYTVDKEELEIEGFLCDKNFPTILVLAPGAKRQEVLRLFFRKGFKELKSPNFKVGLNVIKTTSTQNFDKRLKIKNILWSNEISIW